MRRALLVAAIAAAALAPTAARAQTEAQKQQAKEHYEKARRFYDVGRYADAIDEYQKVYLLVDDPNMLYNIAQAYRLWDKPEEAVRFYRNFLRRSPGAPNRAEVEKKITDLEKAIEDRRRQVTSPPIPAAPSPAVPPPVDAAPTAPPPAPAGLAVAPPPMPTAPPPMGEPAATVSQPGTPEPPSDGRGRRIAAYSFLIGGGALLVTSIITGAMAAQKAKDVEKTARDRGVFNPNVENDGKALSGVAVVTGLVGAAAAITGGILLFTARPREAPAASLFPVVGPDYAGAGARVTF